MADLKTCPFCGGKAFLHEYLYSCEPGAIGLWSAECVECHSATFEYNTAEKAIEAWNRRAEDGKDV